jgi:UDP-N-acetyl-D-galactosamine dehydrogenase
LESFGTIVDIYDPFADFDEVKHEYGLHLISELRKKYHAIILAVGHSEFTTLNWDDICSENTVIYDVKGILDKKKVTARL